MVNISSTESLHPAVRCRCLQRGADLRMLRLITLPLAVSCFSKIQIVLAFLVSVGPDGHGQRAVKWVLLLDRKVVKTYAGHVGAL